MLSLDEGRCLLVWYPVLQLNSLAKGLSFVLGTLFSSRHLFVLGNREIRLKTVDGGQEFAAVPYTSFGGCTLRVCMKTG